jgi:putative RNA 2'-phosphotransferase
MDQSKMIKISTFLSYCLRHHPEKVGLSMDSQGWVEVEELLKACKEKGYPISRNNLNEIVDKNDKKRFSFNEDHSKIRASQGHSIPVELGYEEKKPPVFLYHGTALHNRECIYEEGLKKMQRHRVHLTTEMKTARNVGARYGTPLLFKVSSQEMYFAGHAFFCSENGVWLTDRVPPEFLEEI